MSVQVVTQVKQPPLIAQGILNRPVFSSGYFENVWSDFGWDLIRQPSIRPE
jgi:hypothetical protein